MDSGHEVGTKLLQEAGSIIEQYGALPGTAIMAEVLQARVEEVGQYPN
jgi:hypothetical protein